MESATRETSAAYYTMTSGWQSLESDVQLLQGDCHAVLASLLAKGLANFDSLVTSPPYGVGEYDWGMPPVSAWALMRAAMKPGAFMLASGNPRTFHRQMVAMEDAGWVIRDLLMHLFGTGFSEKRGAAQWAVHKELMGDRATIQRGMLHSEAKRWKDYGSKLKPAWEPIILAQNPSELTMGQSLLAQGVGAINTSRAPSAQLQLFGGFGDKELPPNNLILEEEALEDVRALFGPTPVRYFFCSHVPSSAERHAGCEDLLPLGNDHPTLTPVKLLRWMIRLVTPYGGTVLDPYCGSGSTGMAAALEDCRFVGIDLDSRYLQIASRRIESWTQKRQQQEQKSVAKMTVVRTPTKIRMIRRHGPARLQSGDKRCRKGHLQTVETVYQRPDGRTECKICKQLNRKRGQT